VSKLPVTLGVAATVVVLDQVTKALAVALLEGEPSIPVLGELLQLTFVRNPGAAFSLAGSYTVVISAIAIVVSVFIVRTARTLTSTWWAVVMGGILGGALGNLLDRLLRAPGPFRGHVVDFLELPRWPVFNVADMALVGSAVLAVLLSLRGVELSEPAQEQAEPAQEPAEDAVGPGAGREAAEGTADRPDAAQGAADRHDAAAEEPAGDASDRRPDG
jgi:signal peptidase II